MLPETSGAAPQIAIWKSNKGVGARAGLPDGRRVLCLCCSCQLVLSKSAFMDRRVGYGRDDLF